MINMVGRSIAHVILLWQGRRGRGRGGAGRDRYISGSFALAFCGRVTETNIIRS